MHPAVHQYKQLQPASHQSAWSEATAKHQLIARQRSVLVNDALTASASSNLHQAIKTLKAELDAGTADQASLGACQMLGKVPGTSTLRNWVQAYQSQGLAGLLPGYQGTQRRQYGWEALFLELYHRPQKPSLASVAQTLREQYGFALATEHNVRYFHKTLPAELQDKSPWRLGQSVYRKTVREYITRTTENIPVGLLYQGDGHTVDVYCRHPKTGNLCRIELTVFMDIRSRYIVGWYVSYAESSITSMAALSHAFGTWDHVCAVLYIDNGSGYKSRMMNDDTAGFYANFDLEVIFSLPGNPQAKGNVERFFGVMEQDLGKTFDTYCGNDMSEDRSRLFQSKNIKKLEGMGLNIPTISEWCNAFEDWLERYHNRPHPEVKNQTPAALWDTLERTPVHDMNLLVRPREVVKVHRSMVRLHGRSYRAEYLYQFDGQELIAEYDLHHDQSIRLFKLDGVLLMTAELKAKVHYLPTSRIEEAEERRRQGRLKRLDNKRREVELQESRDLPGHLAQAAELEQITPSMQDIEQAKQPSNDDFSLDVLANAMLRSNKDQGDEPEPDFNPDEFYQYGAAGDR
ncbi:Mu transposase C-terminal domain-containing protein [Bowmanella dokdonensis]|uniref:DDE-type integrase/transposase/recombinase n=1 Tax=Bowmanella dokdonensis TaxID=751969 RepID=A0A939DN07_9ALTE|nr:Mu transposase C-terminal domain-containing protein [Bowmanella dokdonensis]MBN7824756.1 DDE-type integrase/transposase/recombinase [Bowmanella dokdonensis]